jgi:hypothetical protein
MGDLALAGWRASAQLHDHHDDAERAVRRAPRAPRPDAHRPEARLMAGLARRTASGRALTQVPARARSVGRDDVLAIGLRVGNVKNNDPSLIEPIILLWGAAMRIAAAGEPRPVIGRHGTRPTSLLFREQQQFRLRSRNGAGV